MLHRVIGSAGSGKTEYILDRIGESIRARRRSFLIVPEQQSVAYESLLCERFGDVCNLYCETLNFERLPNRVAREFGGLALRNIDKGGACALLSLTAESLRGQLSEYAAVAADADFAAALSAFSQRLKMSMITPENLLAAAEDPVISENASLRAKIKELALILSEYNKNFGEGLFDPRDSLTRLAEELKENGFFRDSCVFIDGYYNFTAQEHAVIAEMISQCREVYVSFVIDGERAFFAENAKSAEIIKRAARNGCEDIPVGKYRRSESEPLRFLEKNIWEPAPGVCRSNDKSVKFIRASDRFEECAAAASEIISYVRAGGRWRDIAVLAGNANTYSGIVDSVFARAGIKCYMSSHESLESKPVVAFMLASIAVVAENFSLRSVKRYIKSGYSGLTVTESDLILSYAESWNIQGALWYSESGWTMDPEGYREGGLSARGEKLLKAVNSAREKLVPALSALKDSLSVRELDVAACVRAVYNHLVACRADEKLRKSAERLLRRGDREGADRETQLWKLLMNILDQLFDVCGTRKVTVKRFESLLKLMCENYSPGAIPASADSVMFGDAALVRAGGCKMLIILGVCDGEFPAGASSGTFFDRAEASVLESIGLELADTMDKSLNAGRFLVYAAFASPTQRLVLSCPRAELTGEELRPSAAFISARAMLPDAEMYEYDVSKDFSSAENVASAVPYMENCELRGRIESALSARGIDYFENPPRVCDSVSRIEYDSDSLMLSPSKFERFALCPFSFFGNYLLGLKEKKKNDWSTPEIGNFIHKILEQFMRRCVSGGRFVEMDDNTRASLVRELTKEYFLDVIGAENASNKRFMHTYENMVRTLELVTKSIAAEFAESKFIPVGFEFRIGLGEPDMPAVRYDVDGKRVFLRGSIDRVDTYVRDGVTYVRVIDYKTYKKRFRADLVAQGIDTQMLHYLFAYCENRGAVPAGVMYYTVTLPSVELTGEESDGEIIDRAEKMLTREGILLDDPDIVFAMSESLDFVPVTRKKDGSFSDRGGRLRSAGDFDELCAKLKRSVRELSTRVFAGEMDIAPNDSAADIDPCAYCRLRGICRKFGEKEVPEDESDDDSE